MNRLSITLVAVCVVTSHLGAQSAGVRGSGRNAPESIPAVAQTMLSGPNVGVRQNLDGSVCFPAPSYQFCDYDVNSYALGFYRLWTYHTLWNGMNESDLRQSGSATQTPDPPPPPTPTVTPVTHEYNWPAEGNTPATFSIVTTSGTVYLATMVWVDGDNVRFNSVDGGVRELALASVSRSLTQTANAQKNLNLPLPWAQGPGPSVATAN